MSVSTSDIDRAWKKLGFEVDDSRRDIHAILRVDGKVVVTTRRSHGAKGASGNIPHFIRQQMRLNEAQFAAAIACPLQRDAYIEILKEKGLV